MTLKYLELCERGILVFSKSGDDSVVDRLNEAAQGEYLKCMIF